MGLSCQFFSSNFVVINHVCCIYKTIWLVIVKMWLWTELENIVDLHLLEFNDMRNHVGWNILQELIGRFLPLN